MVQSFHVLLQVWFVFSSGLVLPSLTIEVTTEYPDIEITEYVDGSGYTAIDPEPEETTDDLRYVTSEAPEAVDAVASELTTIRYDDESSSTSETTVLDDETSTECSDSPNLTISVELLDLNAITVFWNLTGCYNATGYNITVTPIGPAGTNCSLIEETIPATIVAEEESLNITDLSPYYTYNVNVTALWEFGDQLISEETEITTPQGSPPVPNISATVGGTTLDIQWELDGCIPAKLTGYSVSVLGIEALGENCEEDITPYIYTGNESEFRVNGLSAYHTYNVTVTVLTGADQQVTGAINVTTLELAPPAPVIQEVEAIDTSQLFITWNMSNECIPGDLKNYIISITFERSEDPDCEFVEDHREIPVPFGGLNQAYTYTEALPYSLYHVAVAAKTGGGIGNFSSEGNVTTKEQVPPAPDVHAEAVAASFFTVSWDLSGCINSTVKGFSVSGVWVGSRDNGESTCEFNGSKTFEQQVIGRETSYTFHEAIAYSVYTVEVKAFIEGQQYGDSSSLNIPTHETDPPIPNVSTAVVNETTVRVGWEMSACVQANITSYKILLTPLGPKGTNCANDTSLHSKEVYSNQTEVEVIDLIPYHEYMVTVTAKTELGKNNSAQTNVVTLETDPPAPDVSIIFVDKTAVKVGWDISVCVQANITSYEISLTPLGHKDTDCANDTLPHIQEVDSNQAEVEIDDLIPYHEYLVSVMAKTELDKRNSGQTNVTTLEAVPPAPDITNYDFRSQDIKMYWSMPACVNGSVSNFHISVTPEGYLGSEECPSDPESTNPVTLTADARDYTYMPVNPYSKYTVSITAQTAAGEGNPAKITNHTNIYYPDSVRNVTVLDVVYSHSNATVSWEKPCRFNGEPDPYRVLLFGNHAYFESHGINVLADTESVVITDLRPEYEYSVTVRATNGYVYNDSSPILFYQPANIPVYTGTISAPDPYATDDATTKAHFTISQNLFDPRAGCVVYYAILVAEEDQDRDPRQGILNGSCSDWLNTENVAQVTPLCWKPFEADLTCMNSSKITFTIGADSSCSGDYCNAPLKPGTKYYIRVRGYTVSTFADTLYFTFETDSSVNAGLIAGIIVSFLVVGVGIILFLMYRRGTLPWPPGNLLNKTQVSVRPKPVPVAKFPVHCNRMLEIPSRIANEYQLLQTLSSDITATESFSAGQQLDNKRKNRYINILPYDSTRVKLDPIAGDPYSDYINASYIKGYSGDIEYIATQGPKEETCSDFWHMVHQQGVKIIVMVTQLEENGKVKCHKYYPNLRENMVMGDITVRCTTELNFPIYTSRTLLLLKGDRQRSLVHLHFREWPDFGCPASADLMLQFIQVLRHQINLADTGLTVVHCSAGVGRTGTLIAVDILLQHIKENKKVDIFGTVYKLRKQRISMVQSEPQYVYIYRCIKEAVLEPSYLEIEKHSTSSLEPIYENIGNYTISNTSLINYEKLNENEAQSSNSETA